jgi:hypothetical protein
VADGGQACDDARFLTYDHADRLGEAQAMLDRLHKAGQLRPLENVHYGFDHLPEAFIALMQENHRQDSGGNSIIGKGNARVSDVVWHRLGAETEIGMGRWRMDR